MSKRWGALVTDCCSKNPALFLSQFIALTDKNWFDHLKRNANADRIVDEAKFWSPKAQAPPAKMDLGQSVFLRLKSPYYAIAGLVFTRHLICFPWILLA